MIHLTSLEQLLIAICVIILMFASYAQGVNNANDFWIGKSGWICEKI